MSYTIKDLRNKVSSLNNSLLESLSNEYIEEGGRNGYQATDLMQIREDGSMICHSMIGGGTSREVASYSQDAYYSIKESTIKTRLQCKRLLLLNGYDLEKDFHEINNSCLGDLLNRMAKLTKYRKPQNANGSTARYFYAHLVNKVKL